MEGPRGEIESSTNVKVDDGQITVDRDIDINDYTIGRIIPVLPPGYRPIVIGGGNYYEYGGVYFVEESTDNGEVYTVVVPPIGAIVYELPDGYTEVVINGVTYYIAGDVYYRRTFIDGVVGYEVVAPPA